MEKGKKRGCLWSLWVFFRFIGGVWYLCAIAAIFAVTEFLYVPWLATHEIPEVGVWAVVPFYIRISYIVCVLIAFGGVVWFIRNIIRLIVLLVRRGRQKRAAKKAPPDGSAAKAEREAVQRTIELLRRHTAQGGNEQYHGDSEQ